jgi:hypothetical protein
MTYVIGLAQDNMNAIFADCRATHTDLAGMRTGVNGALKTGLLFPGCIFGCCGSSDESERFIVSFKRAISIQNLNDIDTLWSYFMSFFDYQEFGPDHSGFSLMLSVRHPATGPKLYELDSHKRYIRPLSSPGVYTLGSGIAVLDSFVRGAAPRLIGLGEDLATQLKRLCELGVKQMSDSPHAHVEFMEHAEELIRCCVLSYMLNNKSLCTEVTELEEAGVGGVFHFSFQTRSIERPQPVIFLSFPTIRRRSPEKTDVLLRLYRIAYRQGCLFVESWLPANEHADIPEMGHNTHFSIDSRSHDHKLKLSAQEFDEWRDQVVAEYMEASETNFYEFAFFDPIDPAVWPDPFFGFGTNVRRDSKFNRDGTPTEQFMAVLGRMAPEPLTYSWVSPGR